MNESQHFEKKEDRSLLLAGEYALTASSVGPVSIFIPKKRVVVLEKGFTRYRTNIETFRKQKQHLTKTVNRLHSDLFVIDQSSFAR